MRDVEYRIDREIEHGQFELRGANRADTGSESRMTRTDGPSVRIGSSRMFSCSAIRSRRFSFCDREKAKNLNSKPGAVLLLRGSQTFEPFGAHNTLLKGRNFHGRQFFDPTLETDYSTT